MPGRPVPAREQVARETGIWLFEYAPPFPQQGRIAFEVHIRNAGLQLPLPAAVQALDLFRRQVTGG